MRKFLLEKSMQQIKKKNEKQKLKTKKPQKTTIAGKPVIDYYSVTDGVIISRHRLMRPMEGSK